MSTRFPTERLLLRRLQINSTQTGSDANDGSQRNQPVQTVHIKVVLTALEERGDGWESWFWVWVQVLAVEEVAFNGLRLLASLSSGWSGSPDVNLL